MDTKDKDSKLIDFSKHHPLQNTNTDDVIAWIKDLEKKGKIKRLVVVVEDQDRNINTNTINMRNKDYAYFLTQELFNLFGRSD